MLEAALVQVVLMVIALILVQFNVEMHLMMIIELVMELAGVIGHHVMEACYVHLIVVQVEDVQEEPVQLMVK